jgi:hypothetical protein
MSKLVKTRVIFNSEISEDWFVGMDDDLLLDLSRTDVLSAEKTFDGRAALLGATSGRVVWPDHSLDYVHCEYLKGGEVVFRITYYAGTPEQWFRDHGGTNNGSRSS